MATGTLSLNGLQILGTYGGIFENSAHIATPHVLLTSATTVDGVSVSTLANDQVSGGTSSVISTYVNPAAKTTVRVPLTKVSGLTLSGPVFGAVLTMMGDSIPATGNFRGIFSGAWVPSKDVYQPYANTPTGSNAPYVWMSFVTPDAIPEYKGPREQLYYSPDPSEAPTGYAYVRCPLNLVRSVTGT